MDKEGFRLKNIQIRRTVRRKIACPHFTLFLCSVGLSLQCGSLTGSGRSGSRVSEGIGEVSRGW